MDWIPTLKIGLLALTELTAVPPGRLVYSRRAGRTSCYLTFGEGQHSTHLLSLGDQNRFQLFDMAQVRPEKTLALDIADRLRLSVRAGTPDPDRMMDNFGCMGLTVLGPVLCARQHAPNFGGDVPAYLCLPTWRRVAADHQGWLNEVMWFTQWELVFQDEETRERHKVLGAPQWEI